MKKSINSLLLVIAAVAVLSGCEKKTETPAPATPPPSAPATNAPGTNAP